MVTKLKGIIKQNRYRLNKFPFRNRLKGSTKICFGTTMFRHCSVIDKGFNNELTFLGRSECSNCTIQIYGNNNKIIIDDQCVLKDAIIWIEDDGNKIFIGKNTLLTGNIQLACIEGTSIVIGERCLFSSEIAIRTGDSHSIFNESGVRTNDSADIHIGNHVWVGHRVMIQKGVHIQENTVVGAGAVLTKTIESPNVVVAGNPGKIVKTNINWDIHRIPHRKVER